MGNNSSGTWNSLKDRWEGFSPGKKKLSVIIGLVAGVAIAGFVLERGGPPSPVPPEVHKPKGGGKPIIIGDDEYRKATNAGVQNDLGKFKKETDEKVAGLAEEVRRMQAEKEAAKHPSPSVAAAPGLQETATYPPVPAQVVGKQSAPPPVSAYPPPPVPTAATAAQDVARRVGGQVQAVIRPDAGGEVDDDHNPYAEEAAVSAHQAEEKKKDLKKKVKHLIPAGAMMDAILLTGTEAPTIGDGAKDPTPVELMITDEAILPVHMGLKDVLPARIRASLKGCFFIAYSRGNLATERVDIRPHKLTCLSKTGKSVVDSPVKAWVSDVDSKNSVSGRPIHRIGTSMGIAALAAFIKGGGDALSSASQTQTLTGLGTVSSVNSGQVLQQAGGRGVSAAADTLAEHYSKILAQIFPVVEVLGKRPVTVHFEEKLELNMEQECLGLEGGGEACVEEWER